MGPDAFAHADPHAIARAIADGTLPGRVWMYTNYHCNLACSYCLTESSPRSERRQLEPATMLAVAEQAKELGFTGLGVTGGEPFLLPWLPETVVQTIRIGRKNASQKEGGNT